MLYFIQEENNLNGPVKIGISKNPMGRLKTFQAGSSVKLKILKTIDVSDDKIAEQFIHQVFEQYRQQGEWFKLPLDWVEFIRDDEDKFRQVIESGSNFYKLVEYHLKEIKNKKKDMRQ